MYRCSDLLPGTFDVSDAERGRRPIRQPVPDHDPQMAENPILLAQNVQRCRLRTDLLLRRRRDRNWNTGDSLGPVIHFFNRHFTGKLLAKVDGTEYKAE